MPTYNVEITLNNKFDVRIEPVETAPTFEHGKLRNILHTIETGAQSAVIYIDGDENANYGSKGKFSYAVEFGGVQRLINIEFLSNNSFKNYVKVSSPDNIINVASIEGVAGQYVVKANFTLEPK